MEQSKNLFTPTDLRNCYISLRQVWVPLAHKAIDDLCKNFGSCAACGASSSIIARYKTKYDPIELTNKVRRSSKRAALQCNRNPDHWAFIDGDIVDELCYYLSDADSGLETMEAAVEAIAAARKLVPDQRAIIGKCSPFLKAWNREQAEYMKQRYGIRLERREQDAV